MVESVIGAKPSELVSSSRVKEGSLAFTYSKKDIVANSVGHILAIPTSHIPLLTFKNIFQNPSPELVEHFKERYKDVPWKGDVLVRVGHASIVGDLQRLFANDKIRGPLALDFGNSKSMKIYRTIFRLLAVPGVVLGGIHAKLFRSDHYNAFTNTVHIFHPNPAIGMHEIGHAEFFNQERLRSLLYVLFSPLPIVKSFTEYKASLIGMSHMKSDEERRKATKVMEAMWGTYLLRDTLFLSLPFVAASPLTSALVATKTFVLPFGPQILKDLTQFSMSAGIMAGAASGHMLSRLPYFGRRQRFGYVFEGKPTHDKKNLGPHQVYVSTARPV